MNRPILLLLIFTLLAFKTKAQQVFIPQGIITFEKKTNVLRSLAEWDISDEVKEKMQKYKISNWELRFNTSSSLYKAKKQETESTNAPLFFMQSSAANELYANYNTRSRLIKKNIMGDDYLLKDTIPQVNWKIMHDIRNICGYECRKAIGRINDTVYVVAFYTDEILLKGGPEGFSGLPGMILGLAIPRYNTTWFATKIDAFAHAEIIPPVKGKNTETEKEMAKLLELLYKNGTNRKEKPADLRGILYGFTL